MTNHQAEDIIFNAARDGELAEKASLRDSIRNLVVNNESAEEVIKNLRTSLGKEREYSTNLRHSQDQYTTDAFRRGRESATTEAAMQFRHMMDMLKEGNRLQAIKSLRKFANIGLKEAKDYIDTISVAFSVAYDNTKPVTPLDTPVEGQCRCPSEHYQGCQCGMWPLEAPPEIRDASEGGPDCGCGECGGGGHV